MKHYILSLSAALLFSTTALASGDNQNNHDGVAIQSSSIVGSTINNGVGSGSTHNSNVNSAKGGSAFQHQTQSQSIKNSGNSHSSSRSESEVKGSGNSSNSYVEQAQKRNPVSTAYAAPLVTSDETCAYSTSVGAQFIGTGFSAGSTHEATNCVRLKNSRELERKGFKKASIALLCLNNEVREAMEQESTPCPAKASVKLGALSPAGGDDAPTVNDYPTQRPRFE